MQEGMQLNTVLGYRSALPSAVFTLLVGKPQQVSTLTEVTALMAWHPCLYLFTHDLPSHLTCTFLCSTLRLKPRPHTWYTCWTSILPLQHLFYSLKIFHSHRWLWTSGPPVSTSRTLRLQHALPCSVYKMQGWNQGFCHCSLRLETLLPSAAELSHGCVHRGWSINACHDY